MTMKEALKKLGKIDFDKQKDKDLVQLLKKHKIKLDGEFSRGIAMQLLFEEFFKRYIEGLPNVEFCYRIAGNACYMLKMQFDTFVKAEKFIEDVNPYAHTVTHFIFSKVETHLRIGSD